MLIADESVEDNPQEHGVTRVFCMVFAAMSAGFGLLALFGWIARIAFLTSFAADKVPMSPSAALLFLLFGMTLFFHALMPQNDKVRKTGLVYGIVGHVCSTAPVYNVSAGCASGA